MIISNPPSSWIKAAMAAGLVDENHDAKANLMDAINRGFSFENIKSIIKLYVEHRFLDEDDADVFFSVIPIGTTNNEETKEVTDQLLDGGEGEYLLPPHHAPLEEYLSKFTPSQKHAFDYLINGMQSNDTQMLAAVVGATGCGKSFLMGAVVEKLRLCNLVVSKLAPSGVAAALIQGTTIHNFFKLDITGKSSLQNGTIDATAIRKTDVIIIDEFGMIDCKIFLTIENLCRRFSTKDGRHKPWGGRHILLFGDPAQLPPVSNTDIFNTKLWLQFSIVQLREIVRSKDPELSAILSEIRMGKCDETVCSVLKSRLRNVDIDAVDLTRTVIICSKRKEVDLINEECLKRIDGDTHEYKAIDTDSNGQPLREADKQRLQRTPMRLPDTITLKRGCRIVLRRNLQIPQGWVNGALCEVLDITPNCILVCKLGKPDKMYPIARTKQRIDIKGASYSILWSQFPVQLAYVVTVHRVQGLTVDSAIVTLNNNFFASGQAYVALSRVRKLDNLILWDFTPSAIKIAPYYKQLLEWCESVDVIRPTPYDGPCVRYPDRQNDDISCSTMDDDMEAALHIMYQKCEAATMPNTNKQVNFDINTEKNDFYKGSSSNNVPSSAIKQQKPNKVRVTISKTNKKVKGKRDSLKQSPKSKTVAVKATALSSRKRKHVPDKCSKAIKKIKNSTECMITDVENVIGSN